MSWRTAERSRPCELAKELGLDAGYLSRILRRIREAGLARSGSRHRPMAGSTCLSLTARGTAGFRTRSTLTRGVEIGAMLHGLLAPEQARLVDSMQTIESLLSAKTPRSTGIDQLRQHRPGDMGWVVHRHGVLYCAGVWLGRAVRGFGRPRLLPNSSGTYDRKRECCLDRGEER